MALRNAASYCHEMTYTERALLGSMDVTTQSVHNKEAQGCGVF
jgi:hypothetical protein